MLNDVATLQDTEIGPGPMPGPPRSRTTQGRTMTPQGQETGDYSQQTLWLLAVRDQRDKQAFAQLFDHYAPRLRAMLMRSGMSAAVTDDLVQEVLLTTWQKAAQFDPTRAQASAWIYRIARNRQIDLIRRERRPMPDAVMAGEEDSEPDASQMLALDQETGKLREALERLTPDQRAMIEQAYLGDLTHTEIRQRTGLPLGTIKSRIRLGLERLRHELKELR